MSLRKSFGRKNNPRRFSESEKVYVRAHFKTHTIAEMAMHMERHFSSVQSLMKSAGLLQLRASVKRRNSLACLSLPPLEMAYLAGLIDGEGTVSVARRYNTRLDKTYYQPVVVINNTSNPLAVWLKARGMTISLYTSTGRTPCWKMSIGGLAAGDLCRAVLPFLVVKVEQAKLVSSWCVARSRQPLRTKPTPQMFQIYRELRRLNMRHAAPNEVVLKRAKYTM